MKTTLPPSSFFTKDRLEAVVKEIVECQKDRVVMIILFGSYARGDFASSQYVQDNAIYAYHSDIDLLVVLKNGNYAGHRSTAIERKIDKVLEEKGLVNHRSRKEPWISLIFESIGVINRSLEQGRYFYSDIKKDGVLLYRHNDFDLAEARELSQKEMGEIAKEEYDHWFEKGREFINCSKDVFSRNKNNFCAFFLHQATESFYNAILLVFTGYKPKLHNIKKLMTMIAAHSSCPASLSRIFYFSTSEQRKCFDLLKRAYTEARYSKSYKINKKQLGYLMERIEELQEVTERVCSERISGYERAGDDKG